MTDTITDGVYRLEDMVTEDMRNLSLAKIVMLLAYHIAKHPEDATVRIMRTSRVTVLEFDLHPKDRGPFLGGDGRTIRSLRTVVKAMLGPLVRSHSIRIDLANDDMTSVNG